MAAPADGTETTATFSATTDFSCAYPTVADGTFLVCLISANGGGTVAPPDSTWKRMPRMGGHTGITNVGTHWGYYKVADGTETGDAVFVNSAARSGSMVIMPFSGVNRYLPFSYVRVGSGSDDQSINNLASRFADGLGVCAIMYESAVDETGTAMSGGAAANWSTFASVDVTATTHYGVVVYKNTANFATTTFGAGSTTWNATAGFTDSAHCTFMLNADDSMSADPVSASWLYRASAHSAGSSVTTVPGVSTDLDGGITLARCMILPGMTIVGSILANNESAVVSDWNTDQSSQNFTQVTGSPYDHTGASPALSLSVGYTVLGEEDCYVNGVDDFGATITSSIVEACYHAYYVEDAATKLNVKEGTFETVDSSTTAPDPTSITTTYDDTIVVTIDGQSGSASASTAPSGYTDGAEARNTSGNFDLSVADNKVDVAGTEDPGAWTTASGEHVMYSLGITKSAVDPPTNTIAPAVTPTADPDVDDVLTTTDGTWTGSPTFTYQWQRSDDGVSGWTNIGSATATTYTLVSADESKYIRCVVTATNAGGTESANSNVVGAVGARLTVSSPTLPQVNTGGYFDQQSTTPSGGTAPYTYAIQSGSLPAGLSLAASTGRITGVPTGAAGTSTFVVRVTDAQSQTEDTGTLSITVVVPAVAIDSPSVSDGRVGRAYDQQLRASGGVAPYTFTVTSGSLPPGLSLSSDGRISGTPTTPGGYRVRIRATDSASNFAERWY